MRFLLISMLSFGVQFAFDYTDISSWWPWSGKLLTAIGFLSGALVAYARVCPQQNLPSEVNQ